MKIAISGASGLVGTELVPFLKIRGHEVISLVRDDPAPGEICWNPEIGELDPTLLEGVEAIINLSGENVAGRWSQAKKRKILQSRVEATRTWVEAIKKMSKPPQVFINASAVGFYGNAGNQVLDENAPKGTGFLADVCKQWEEELEGLDSLKVRIVPLRIGVILTPKGGALGKMLLPFKMGLGGIIGSGDQYISWISMDDLLGIFDMVLTNAAIAGPVNAVAPTPVTNREFTKALGEVLHRPTFVPLPAFAARLVFGEAADEMLLVSTRACPKKLEQWGFTYAFPSLESYLRHILAPSTT